MRELYDYIRLVLPGLRAVDEPDPLVNGVCEHPTSN